MHYDKDTVAGVAQFEGLLAGLADGVLLTDRDGRIRACNTACGRLAGCSESELLGRDAYGLTLEAWTPEERRAVEDAASGQAGPLEFAKTLAGPEGLRTPVQVCLTHAPGDDEGSAGLWWVIRDVSERQRIEAALRKRQDMLRRAQAVTRTGSWHSDLRTNALEWSEETYRIFDVPRDAVLRYDTFIPMVHAEDRGRLITLWEEALAGRGAFEVEHRIVVRGEVRWVLEKAEIEFDVSGQPLTALGTVQDITDRVRAEEEKLALEAQLRHAQKLEAMGTLASGVAHDFGNILGIIAGHAELMQAQRTGDGGPLDSAGRILAACERARALVKQILAFSRHDQSEMRAVPLDGVVREAIDMLKAGLPRNVALEGRLSCDGRLARADTNQLHQVLMNLCVNAAQALGDRPGHITVATECVTLGSSQLALYPSLHEGDYLCITVSDTGCGVPPEYLDRVFEPFFTTKAPGAGTGMGLSVVHGIVRNHGGAVRIESEVGTGTVVTVLFPVCEAEHNAEAAADFKEFLGHGRILVVDDEEELGQIHGRLLELLGYETVVHSDPREALACFRENPFGFDLVLSDYAMPHMDGLALRKKLQDTRPELPVVLCTAYWDEVLQLADGPAEGTTVLTKPVTHGKLAKAVSWNLQQAGKNRGEDSLPAPFAPGDSD